MLKPCRVLRGLLVYRLLFVLIGIWLITACSQTPRSYPDAAVNGTASPAMGYPAPESAYPRPATSAAYPNPSPTLRQGPKFTINTPIAASDTQVTGTGPAGVPIVLIDITKAGEVIATTTIREDGSFSFDVAGKLTSGNRVALVLGDTRGTSFDPGEFVSGPGYQDFPMIGILFDSAIVE